MYPEQEYPVKEEKKSKSGKERIVEKALKCFEEASRAEGSWRKMAKKTYRFYAGDQWDQEVIDRLIELKKPQITRNQITPAVDVLSGFEQQNKQMIRVLPRTVGASDTDPFTAQIETEAIRYFLQRCDGDVERTDAFKDAIICGRGVLEGRPGLDDDSEVTLIIERCHPLEFYVDPRAKKRNYADAGYVIRVKHVDRDEVKRRWPKVSDEALSSARDTSAMSSEEGIVATQKQPEPDRYYSTGEDKPPEEMIEVLEYQWRENDFIYDVILPPPLPGSGQKVRMTKDEVEELESHIKRVNGGRETARKSMAEEQRGFIPPDVRDTLTDLQAIEVGLAAGRVNQVDASSVVPIPDPQIGPPLPVPVCKRAYIVGKTLLEVSETPIKTEFSYKFITAKRDDQDPRRVSWFGAVKNMISPQEWSNKTISEIQHILATMPKGGAYYEEGAFIDEEEAIENFAAGDALIALKPGGLGKLKPRETGGSLAALNALYQFANLSGSGIREATGINIELMGQSERDIAGTVISHRARQALMTQAEIFTALRLFNRKLGRYMLEMIRVYIPDNTIIRITGNDTAKFVSLTKNKLAQKYDVIVDEAPDSPNYKREFSEFLKAVLPALVKSGVVPPPEVLRYIDGVPPDFAEFWIQDIKQKQAMAAGAIQQGATVTRQGASVAPPQGQPMNGQGR